MKIDDIIPAEASEATVNYMTFVLEKLEATKAVDECDVGALHILGTCYEMYVQLSRELFKAGAITKDRKGKVSANPLSVEMLKYMDKVLGFSKDFGLTVKSRDLIKSMTPAVSDDNIVKQFIESQKSKDEQDGEQGLEI